MGLAATQARFLAITSRKTNCEFQSMEIAQQKLSITRELERATEEYQSALNTTKLVWDPDGTGDNAFDLSYDIMMKPSAVNNYLPYLISTRDGRIVLNSKMASAAEQAGIPKNGCEPTDSLYEKFINQMVKNGGMSETSAVSCRTIGLLNKVGIGGPLLDKTQASEMGINDLIAYMDLTIAEGEYGSPAQQKLAEALQFNYGVDDTGKQTLNLKNSISDKGDQNSNYFTKNGSITTDTSFTFSDLLTDDITYARTGAKNPSGWKKFLAFVTGFAVGGLLGAFLLNGSFKELYGANGGNMADWSEEDKAMLDFIDQMANGFIQLIDVDKDDPKQAQAFEYAIQQTVSMLTDTRNLGSRNNSTGAFKDAVKESNNYNGWVTKSANKGSNYGTTAISLSNLTESFMTNYAQAMNGFDQTYYTTQLSNKSSYVTDDPYYMWKVRNPDANTTEEMYISEFYSAMFNNICQNGWTENNQIDDNDYLSNSLKNAQYFIKSLSKDNYYYQDRYLDNGYVLEVNDDDAITEAELAYTQKKSKLNYKEERLELNMKKLDLEISSLTTEYDTVKNLINNNVEKTYTMFNT